MKLKLHRSRHASILLGFMCALCFQGSEMSAIPYSTPTFCGTNEYFRTTNLSCTPCGANKIPSTDRLSCTCPHARRFVRSTGACVQCSSQQVVSEDGQYCLTCLLDSNCTDPEGLLLCKIKSTKYIYDDYFSGITGNRSCRQCPPGTWADPSQHRCVECSTADCTTITCTKVTDGTCSAAAAQLCSVTCSLSKNGNITSCNLAVNLCALNNYSPSDPSCKILPSIYGQAVPSLLSSNAYISAVLSTKSSLPLVVASYSIDGVFGGIKNVSDDILLCKDLPSRMLSAWTTGTLYKIECKVFFATPTSPFFELYFHDYPSNLLYPIPIVISSYKDSSGILINQESDSSHWQYVRRFYLWASVGEIFSYIQVMQLRFVIGSDGNILSYLHIVYNTTSDQKTSFDILYMQDGNQFNIGISVTAAVLFGLVAVYSAVLTNGYLRRTGRNFCELPTLLFLVVQLCSALSSVFFVLLFASSVLWLILYKAQSSLTFVLPVNSQELAFKILIAVAFTCRLLHVGYLLSQQCSIDVFFVDWERPKSITNPPTNGTPSPAPNSAVSVWRSLFVANEWNKLQSIRKINPVLLVVMILLLLKVAGFEYLAEQEPYSHISHSLDRYSPSYSSVLRFSLTALHFLVTATIMRTYIFVIHERYIQHKIKDFVDLCSISNVSVLILYRKLYGYYIHGRSVHGHAETNMREMLNNLHKEEEDLCSKRGLATDSDVQTFELSLTRKFRTLYDSILLPLSAEIGSHNVSRTEANRSGSVVSEISLETHENMNHFLSLFVERNLSEVDYIVKDKLLLEKVLGIELSDPTTKSILYNDPGYSFDTVLFYGNEWALFQCDLLVFAAVDLIAQDYVLAAIVTCTLTLIIKQVRSFFGHKNISKKAVIDSRFMM